MKGPKPKKPVATPRKPHSSTSRAQTTDILKRLTSEESCRVLRLILHRHRELRREAEEIATELISSPTAEDVAADVLAAVTCIGEDEVIGRSGRTEWGYVDPGDAALELLEEAVESCIDDMKRKMELGLADAAEAMCAGIVLGLHRAGSEKPQGALDWAPEFPAEEARHVVKEFIRVCPAPASRGTRERLLKYLAEHVPDWMEIFSGS